MPINVQWTDDKVNKLRQDVAALVEKGYTKKAAYGMLQDRYKIGASYMGKLVNYGPETLRENAKKYKYPKARSTATPEPQSNGVRMTPAEALQFYNFCRQLGITIA